jgi:hypothetical protein
VDRKLERRAMSRRTRERKIRERREREVEKLEARQHWKKRLGHRAVVMLTTFLMIWYVTLAGRLTFEWFSAKWVRLTPVGQIDAVARSFLVSLPPRPEEFRTWLAYRPSSEGDYIIKTLTPWSSKLSGMTFLIFARWEEFNNRPEEAAFWREYARFRIRDDALRCGSYDAIGLMGDILKLVPPTPVGEQQYMTPETLPKLLRRILDFDTLHPPQNYPLEFCHALTATQEFHDKMKFKMEPPSGWEDIHRELRSVTLMEVMHLEAINAQKNGDKPANGKSDKPETPKPCPKSGPKSDKTADGNPCKPAPKKQ